MPANDRVERGLADIDPEKGNACGIQALAQSLEEIRLVRPLETLRDDPLRERKRVLRLHAIWPPVHGPQQPTAEAALCLTLGSHNHSANISLGPVIRWAKL